MENEELLAVFDAAGRQIGVKSRGQIHRDGDWHLTVFVWAARLEQDGSRRFLLQLRSRPDDPYRGQVDALAGGHVWAVETHIEGAVREFREEAGIEVHEEDLVYLGRRFLENPQGVCKKVIEHFYVCRRPIHLSEPVFSSEANGFIEVDLDEFSDLLEGKLHRVDAQARSVAHGDAVHSVGIGMEALAAYSDQIRDSFRRSVRAVGSYLETGEVDRHVWD